MNIHKAIFDAQSMHDDADNIVARALKSAGWHYTCQTPGSLWMWEKKMNDRTVLVDKSTAIAFEEQAQKCPAELGEDK